MSQDPEVALLLQWCELALAGLGEARQDIDALNVFPVPDGDTGTNMYLTFEAARQAVLGATCTSLAAALTVLSRGALLGARGSSGVLLSQLLGAVSERLLRGSADAPGQRVAEAIAAAAAAAYDAVAEPVEGTILTVARAAGDAALLASAHAPPDRAAQLGTVVRAAATGAREALARTTEQLPALARAGVVDAGGSGLCVILDAAEEAFTGRRPMTSGRVPVATGPATGSPRHPGLPDATTLGADLSEHGPAYEVMYLLEAEDARVLALRKVLAPLGDSLVVVGGDGLWNVHVHVNDVGAAVEAGIEAGRPYRLRITHFAEQAQANTGPPTGPSSRGVVVFAAGPGLGALFEDAGATVVRAEVGRRPSTGQLLDAIRSTGATEVVVLPNDSGTVLVAEAAAQAARDEGVRAAVIPTRTQVQGIAAMAVHEPGRRFDDDVVHMTSSAGHARHGAVTVAAKDAMTMAGPCRAGDALGVVEGDFAIIGTELGTVATEVVDRLLSGGGEMVTLVCGRDCDSGLAAAVRSHVEATRAEVDVVCYDGGQVRYPLLIGVE